MARDALVHGNLDEAEHCLAVALKRNKKDHGAYALTAEVRLAQKRAGEALLFYMRAVEICPQVQLYKERFVALAGASVAATYSRPLANALIACLRTRELDCTKLMRFWKSLLQSEPLFAAAYGLADRRSFDPSNKAFFEGLVDFRPLFTPLFLEGLKKLLVCDPVFEEFITHVRRHLLSDIASPRRKFRADEFVCLASALSHYALLSDFVLDITVEEQQAIDALHRRIETDESAASNAGLIALLACYQPLHRLANANDVHANFAGPGPLQDVVKAQITDYCALREVAAAVPSVTEITDGISAKVREQYEDFPYPRWKDCSKQTLLQNWQALECNRRTEGALRGKSAKILIAGCGTGHEAAVLSTIFPDAAITAVDLSRASLAYAEMRSRELGLSNIAFRHGDILRLGSLQSRFDYVYCMGVLHHMEKPIDGWKTCCDLLKPGGLMRIGLYSEIGRRAVAAGRDAIRKRGYSSDRNGMLKFRREAPNVLDRETMIELANFSDYYNMNMYRDLLFHVQEHRFGIPEIARILKELGLVFEGFYLSEEILAQYGKLFPEDTRRTNLENWHRFEQRHPKTFMYMYIFWSRTAAAH